MQQLIGMLDGKVKERAAPTSNVLQLWGFRRWAVSVMSAAVQRGNSKLVDVALELAARAQRGGAWF